MSDKVIANHAEHLAKLTNRAASLSLDDMKKLLDYLILYKGAK
jgi:hypothetical protein